MSRLGKETREQHVDRVYREAQRHRAFRGFGIEETVLDQAAEHHAGRALLEAAGAFCVAARHLPAHQHVLENAGRLGLQCGALLDIAVAAQNSYMDRIGFCPADLVSLTRRSI